MDIDKVIDAKGLWEFSNNEQAQRLEGLRCLKSIEESLEDIAKHRHYEWLERILRSIRDNDYTVSSDNRFAIDAVFKNETTE